MAALARGSWDEPLKGPREQTTSRQTIIISPWPAAAQDNRLLYKHAVQALYEGGNAYADMPMTSGGFGPRLYAGIFLNNQQVGFLKVTPKTRPQGSEPNGTLELTDVVKSTSPLRLVDAEQSTGVTQDSGVVVDPKYPNFKANYRIGDGMASPQYVFSVLLDAIAEAAPYDHRATGAYVNAASVSGDLAFNLHGTDLSEFTWGQLVYSVVFLWVYLVGYHLNKVFDFEMIRNGVKIGEGFLVNVTAPGSSLASS